MYSCIVIVVTLKTLCPVGEKLFVTMTIKNVTLSDDSSYGLLGRYECHAFAKGDPLEKKHGFSVNVISSKYLYIVQLSCFRNMILCIIILYCALFIVYCKQERAYSGIQVSPAKRLDRKMRRQLILQETW